jgi:hypothetical protein
MIKVFFPPGCYGTYLTRCLYNYTNLRKGPLSSFSFSEHGSSHQHRDDLYAKTVIQAGHVESLSVNEDDQVVTIFPCADRQLDYYNNQFFKNCHGQLVEYILSQLTQTDAEHKLNIHWGYNGKFDATVPRWIMREWCSFWIAEVLKTSYNITKYSKIKSVVQLSTQDIFENFSVTLNNLVKVLRLEFTVNEDLIYRHHSEF